MKLMGGRVAAWAIGLALCGASPAAEIQPRIVGGVESSPTAYPWMAALMQQSLEFRSGSGVFQARFLAGSKQTLFSGPLVDCAQGFDVCPDASGKVCLIERGSNLFRDKARNCQAAGGVGAIIYNHLPGDFPAGGTIEDENATDTITIPVVGVSRSTGVSLRADVGMEAGYYRSDSIPTSSFCGGSYIGNGWVLTAAHCVFDITLPQSLSVNIGGFDLEKDQDNVIGVEEIDINPAFNIDTVNNDFALLRLARAPRGVEPILLADASLSDAVTRTGEVGTTIGRGLQNPVGINADPDPEPIVTKLFEVRMPFVPNSTCNFAYTTVGGLPGTPVTSAMICAGTGAAGQGSCFGDSGGPIIVDREGRAVLVGLTSWGLGCAQEGLYDVFSRVSSDLDRIRQLTSITPYRLSGGASGGGIPGGGADNPGGDNQNHGGGSLGWLMLGVFLVLRRVRRPHSRESGNPALRRGFRVFASLSPE